MNYIKINGQLFDGKVAISKYNSNLNVLDGPNAGRGMDGRMIRDVIGTYLGHNITVRSRGMNTSGIDEFWDFIVKHSTDDFVRLEAVDGQKNVSYDAYYTSASHDLVTADDGENYWGEVSVNFIPMKATATP